MKLKEFSFFNNEDKRKLKQVFELVKQNKIKEAAEIADTLSDEAKNKIPDSILFKFSQLAEMSSTGGGATFTPGTGEGVASKIFGKKKKFKKLPKLANIMNESLTYSKFRNEVKTRTKSQQLHRSVKEVQKRLQEINKVLEFTNRMRQELSENDNNIEYSRYTEQALQQIKEMTVHLYKSIKELKK